MRTPEQLSDAVAQAALETERLERHTQDLLFLAKRDDRTAAQFEATALVPMLEVAIDASQPRARTAGGRIELDGDPTVIACVAVTLLRPAVDNLLTNALRYSPPGSTITIRLHRNEAGTAIDVLDEGPGFAPEFLAGIQPVQSRRSDRAAATAAPGSGSRSSEPLPKRPVAAPKPRIARAAAPSSRSGSRQLCERPHVRHMVSAVASAHAPRRARSARDLLTE